ncbi:MAG: putative iron-regulated protein [Rhodothermales bacterium]|jgi:uncharacterized iron-regulated protein
MRRTTSFLLLALLPGVAFAQATTAEIQSEDTLADSVTADHFRLYTGDGDALTWDDLASRVAGADVILVGENHNDPVAHHIEFAVYNEALALDRPASVSMEMFTRDVQGVIDEYLSDLITEKLFLAESRPWKNYDTDYRPFVEAAREAGSPVIAANAPRRYVNMVSRMGPDALSELPSDANRWLAPLPYKQASVPYKAEWDALMSEAMYGMPQDTTFGEHKVMDTALAAQSLWDATMAFSIAEHLLENPDSRVVHMVGSFHVKNGTGIPEHLERYRPGTRVLIVVVEPSEDPEAFLEEHHGLGDIVILGDAGLPRSY